MANDISIINSLSSLRPGCVYTLRNGVIEWLDTEQDQPSQEEIDAEIKRLQSA